ncbi:hypothetical protein B590_30118 (plasmid) [Streptomyces sp. PVA_94-07]|nr:hypothetical protein B590_30118 [Streptomyces sp. PVA_94-07]
MFAFLTRHKETPMSPEPAAAEELASAPAVRMQFVTQGGADVNLYDHTFETRYLPRGRPDVGHGFRTVDGYRWKCMGCELVGKVSIFDENYLPNELDKARTDANDHAANCRSKPKPSS